VEVTAVKEDAQKILAVLVQAVLVGQLQLLVVTAFTRLVLLAPVRLDPINPEPLSI
jgi:hypothetical protein